MSKPLTPEEIGKRVDSLCEQVAEGKTLRQISASMKLSVGMLLKMVAVPPYSEQYTRARESAADLFEADIITAAMAVTPETAAADRVQIEALKWVAGRRAPKKYGDRIQQDVTVDVKDGLAEKMAAARERAQRG
ncbi:terminase small subunit [Pseudomonas sp. MT-1]|uniref:terminase small subunit-like protein n=1 Tax=Stutzerimonas TaxID=2901164 RepID=UPI000535F6D9|nr:MULTISPECIES: hypothetical protein [Stutzerimonas]MCQ4282563.1 hypothetical protein [Stutzerimonas stutzeri]BAP80913.1 terminase small subunit [Pseudomonas sp. MT-1]